jgi:hypothetical protein
MTSTHEQDREHDGRARLVHGHGSHVPDASRPAVFAARACLIFDPSARSGQVADGTARFLAALSDGLAAAGCTLVGHIKGTVVADEGGGGLAFHATMLGAAPALTGSLAAGDVAGGTLTINVIVFDVDERALPALVREAWSDGAAAAATTWHD